MSERRLALLVGNDQFQDAGLRRLVAPPRDLEALGAVLSDEGRGGFAVTVLHNRNAAEIARAVEAFFKDQASGDLALFYYTGHGIKDEDGRLYFAAADSDRRYMRSSSVAASFLNEVATDSRAGRQVLLLDCCYSGAFAPGMTARDETAVHVGEILKAQGRVVLTASKATQYSFEGDVVAGQGVRSLFTRRLIEGIESGDADADGDGLISLDELYDYVCERVVLDNPAQRPGKWAFGVEGKIVLARSPRPPRPAELPAELRDSIDDRRPWVRRGAVGELESLRDATDVRIRLAAEEALRQLARGDDSAQVREAANAALRGGMDATASVPMPSAAPKPGTEAAGEGKRTTGVTDPPGSAPNRRLLSAAGEGAQA